MTVGKIDPEKKGAAALETETVIAKSDPQSEVRAKAHTSRPDEHVSAVRLRAKNEDLDKFRHLFGPKRTGR